MENPGHTWKGDKMIAISCTILSSLCSSKNLKLPHTRDSMNTSGMYVSFLLASIYDEDCEDESKEVCTDSDLTDDARWWLISIRFICKYLQRSMTRPKNVSTARVD